MYALFLSEGQRLKLLKLLLMPSWFTMRNHIDHLACFVDYKGRPEDTTVFPIFSKHNKP